MLHGPGLDQNHPPGGRWQPETQRWGLHTFRRWIGGVITLVLLSTFSQGLAHTWLLALGKAVYLGALVGVLWFWGDLDEAGFSFVCLGKGSRHLWQRGADWNSSAAEAGFPASRGCLDRLIS